MQNCDTILETCSWRETSKNCELTTDQAQGYWYSQEDKQSEIQMRAQEQLSGCTSIWQWELGHYQQQFHEYNAQIS